MATIPAPPCSSPTSMLLISSSCCWRSAPKAVARASAVAAARRTLSSGWNLPRLSAARPAARKARLEELDTSNMLLRQRIIFLGSPQVDDLSADLIISQLLLLDAEDHTKDIRLFINSPGGSITAGMGIYDAMKFCKADISTVCFGLAASMGAFLLAAGTKGKRFCMPNARIMIHQPSGGAGGKPSTMGEDLKDDDISLLLKDLPTELKEVVAQRTGDHALMQRIFQRLDALERPTICRPGRPSSMASTSPANTWRFSRQPAAHPPRPPRRHMSPPPSGQERPPS